MKPNGDYESKLWKVVEKEGLADLSQYHRNGFFDEVPFFSRFKDVAFLREFGREQADAALLRFALKFLKALIWYEIPEQPFLAALTIWNNPEDELIVPNLFVCNGKVQEQVGDNLALHPAKAVGSRRIAKLLSRLHMVEPFQALEDSSTAPNMTRVFVGYSIPPYPNVVPLHALAKRVAPLRQRA
ncbi:MAG TPA: Imm15 family immunity protein [Pirellulales bacterium]|jgi:hypothetical protein|nr:Imm15 family immunity protein [Pirellulales bacterium]